MALGPGLALADGHAIPLGKEWRAPSQFGTACRKYPVICTRTPNPHDLSPADYDYVKKVNTSVNHSIRQVSDQRQYHKKDVWVMPDGGSGDCEDIAMLKKAKLIEHGVGSEHLLLATVLDEHREGHAILILRTRQGDFVLDSKNSKVKRWSQTPYVYMTVQDPRDPRRWDLVLDPGTQPNSGPS